MLVRYKKNEKGLAVKQAEIYVQQEHGISAQDIDPDALKIIRRLHGAGHSAYVVGGAVRDLILGNKPKDFDIVTDASPAKIRKLFRNSRIIGRRFRLVHIFFGEKIIEVSTFRAEISGGFMNVYGEIEEDVKRRDFTINSLYYNPEDATILDYTGGVRDVRGHKLRPVIDLKQIFAEDPVRMIRAIKYAVSGNLTMGFRLRQQLKRSVPQLAPTPASRMTEELFKIIGSGRSVPVFEQCERFGLLAHMLPATDALLRENKVYRAEFYRTLGLLDELVRQGETRKSRLIAYLCAAYLYDVSPLGQVARISFTDTFADLKAFIRPMVPANKDVEQALVHLIRRRKVYRKYGTIERPEGVTDEERPRRSRPRKRKRQQAGSLAAEHESFRERDAGEAQRD